MKFYKLFFVLAFLAALFSNQIDNYLLGPVDQRSLIKDKEDQEFAISTVIRTTILSIIILVMTIVSIYIILK